MNTINDLLLNPTSDHKEHSLKLSLLKSLIEMQVVDPKQLLSFDNNQLVPVDSFFHAYSSQSEQSLCPIWVAWLFGQPHQLRSQAAEYIWSVGQSIDMDWMQIAWTDEHGTWKGADVLAYMFDAQQLDVFLQSCSSDVIQALQKEKPSPKRATLSIHSIMMRKTDKEEAINVLLSHGWDINQLNTEGNTALFANMQWDTAKILIEAGADLNKVSSEGQDIWAYSPKWGRKSNEAAIVRDYLTKALQKKTSITDEQIAINALYQILAANRIGGVEAQLKKIHTYPNNDVIKNNDKTVAAFLYQDTLNTCLTGRERNKIANHIKKVHETILPYNKTGGWIDLSYTSSLGLTDEDQLMFAHMTLECLRTRYGHSIQTANDDLQDNINNWCAKRMEHVISLYPTWVSDFAIKNDILEFNLAEHNNISAYDYMFKNKFQEIWNNNYEQWVIDMCQHSKLIAHMNEEELENHCKDATIHPLSKAWDAVRADIDDGQRETWEAILIQQWGITMYLIANARSRSRDFIYNQRELIDDITRHITDQKFCQKHHQALNDLMRYFKEQPVSFNYSSEIPLWDKMTWLAEREEHPAQTLMFLERMEMNIALDATHASSVSVKKKM